MCVCVCVCASSCEHVRLGVVIAGADTRAQQDREQERGSEGKRWEEREVHAQREIGM